MAQEEFGVVIATYHGDYHFAKASCESVRTFMPGVPICLIADGDARVESVVRAYGAQVLHRADVADPFLRENSFGFGMTKMVAFWEAPFDRFLYLDADTVVWGDVRKNVDFTQADFITNTPHEPNPASKLATQYFELDRLESVIGPLDWQDRFYFNAGVYFARRGCFSLDHYKRLYALHREHPGLLKAGEQGLLNLMAIQAQDAGELAWTHAPLQTILGQEGVLDGFGPKRFVDPAPRFRVVGGVPEVAEGDHTVLHWAAGKPLLGSGSPGTELMTHFRRAALARTHPHFFSVADTVLRAEERLWTYRQAVRKGPRHTGAFLLKAARRAGGGRVAPATGHSSASSQS